MDFGGVMCTVYVIWLGYWYCKELRVQKQRWERYKTSFVDDVMGYEELLKLRRTTIQNEVKLGRREEREEIREESRNGRGR